MIAQLGNQQDPSGAVMSTNNQHVAGLDVVVYEQNRRRIPQEEMEPFAGKWVAISGDGKRILASGADLATAEANLAALGIPGNSVGWERLPGPDEDTSL